MKVNGHSPHQEAIARILSGINIVPAEERNKMVSRASKIGWECDQTIAKLRAFVETVSEDAIGFDSDGGIVLSDLAVEALALLKEIDA